MSDQQNNFLPAAIRTLSAERRAELAGIAKDDGYDLPDNTRFVLAEISSNLLDSHFSRMDADTTLFNFASGASDGVAVLDSHKRILPVGRSLTGLLENTSDRKRVLSDFYIVPGIQLGNHSYASTDDFVLAIDTGTVRKISIGYGGKSRELCDICGEKIWAWRSNCPHIPGLEYELESGDSVVCTYTIYDGFLREYSLVYEGSTPQATVLKAERMAKDGDLSPHVINQFERQYQCELPAFSTYGGVDMSGTKKQGGEAPARKNPPTSPAPLDTIRETLAETAAPEGTPESGVRWLAEQNGQLSTRVAELEAENARLTPLAADGETYRADLIEGSLKQAVRALGNDADLETYRSVLENAGIPTIKAMGADWKRTADAAFGKPPRIKQNNGNDPQTVATLPDSAYSV